MTQLACEKGWRHPKGTFIVAKKEKATAPALQLTWSLAAKQGLFFLLARPTAHRNLGSGAWALIVRYAAEPPAATAPQSTGWLHRPRTSPLQFPASLNLTWRWSWWLPLAPMYPPVHSLAQLRPLTPLRVPRRYGAQRKRRRGDRQSLP